MKINKKIWMCIFLIVWSIGVPLFMWWTYYHNHEIFQKCLERRASPECAHSFCDCFYRPASLDIWQSILVSFVFSFVVFLFSKKTRIISAYLLVFLSFTFLVAIGKQIIGNVVHALYLLPIIWAIMSYKKKRISEQDFKNRLIVCGVILYPLICFFVLRYFE